MLSTTGNRLRVNFNEPLVGRSDLNGWFDRVLGLVQDPASASKHACALWEDEEHVYLELDLPGIKAEDLEVTVHEGALKISAERKAPEAEREYRYNDRIYGQQTWSFRLPKFVDPDGVDASLADGVLSVTLNKRQEAQPKRVSIKTN